MAKLKKTNVTLQIEVKNNDEWNEIIDKEGLTVVEIYSDWSGPCTAMVSTLKKIKMELGGDLLNYVLARNNDIIELKRFRDKCEPVWMFVQNGKLVNIFFGSHCPNLRNIIIEEIKRVQNNELPKYELSIGQRTPYEEVKFMKNEALKKINELEKKLKEEEIEKKIYEEYLEQMMIELCEETALIIFPWVFYDCKGHIRDEKICPPYLELTSKILPDRFDIVEQIKIQLNENIIDDIFEESDVIVTDDLIYGLTEGECIAMRLKGRIPPSTWPVAYPNVCIEEGKKCPTRAFNDVENFLGYILNEIPTTSDHNYQPQSFLNHYQCIIDDGEEEQEEGEEILSYPAVWYPSNARNKVHVFRTLFTSYMNRVHPYEKPEKPLPLIAFKFDLSKLSLISDNYQEYKDAIEYFGIYEFDDSRSRKIASSPQDYIEKFTRQTNNEIILIIIRKINEKIFLAFAGNNPIFIEENEMGVVEIIHKYFPKGAVNSESDSFSQDDDIQAESAEFYYKYGEFNEGGTFY